MDTKWLDSIIEPILKHRTEATPKFTPFIEKDLIKLTHLAREAFLERPMLLEIEPAINICGDIHGQLPDLLRIFETNGYPPKQRYLFMGDLVDRGRYNLEVISLLFAYKIKYPDQVHVLRGNHEDASLTRVYGFMDECKRRYSMALWKAFVNAFDCMPLAAVVGSKIFCVHGGISPSMRLVSEINEIPRPGPVGSAGLRTDLLWADPDPTGSIKSYAPNVERGCSFMFGNEAVVDFLGNNNLDLLCRAHEVAEDGYQFNFNRKVVTVFSAPNYSDSYTNSAAVMKVSSALRCSFNILQPKSKFEKEWIAASPVKRLPRSTSPVPTNTSPAKRVTRGSSPVKRITRSPSPVKRVTRGSSPVKRITRSPSPRTRRRSPSPRRLRKLSPVRKQRSPVLKRLYTRANKISPRLSPVTRKRSPKLALKRLSRK